MIEICASPKLVTQLCLLHCNKHNNEQEYRRLEGDKQKSLELLASIFR